MTLKKVCTVLILTVSLLACGGPKMIPEEDMSDIFREMYMLDQWLDSGQPKPQVDSVLVYGTIFSKYGYGIDDFRYSLRRYLEESDAFVDVLDGAMASINGRLAELTARDSLQAKADSIRMAHLRQLEEMDLPVLYKDLLVGFFPADTVCPGPDSLPYCFRVPVLDTMFNGPALMIREPADTLTAAADSLAAAVPEEMS